MPVVKQRASVPAQDDASLTPAVVTERDHRPKDGTRATAEWMKLQALAVRQLDRFMSLEPKVLRGEDPEAIHDMRVASRRLQQVLDLIYPPPAPRGVRRLRRRIRRCRRALGEVRNCDVLLARVEKSLANSAKTGIGARGSEFGKIHGRITESSNTRRAVWETAREYLRARRSENFDKALRKLGKTNVAALYVGLKEHLALNGAAAGIGDSGFGIREETQNPDAEIRTSSSFYQRVGGSMESAWKDFAEKVGESHRQPQASTLHGVRIAAKRLRYMVEVIEEFDVPGSGESAAWLRELQRHLGDWHDLEVMEGMLAEMLARPRFIRDHLEVASGVFRVIRRNRRVKKKFEEKYLQVTRHSADYERTKRWATHLSSSPAVVFPPPA